MQNGHFNIYEDFVKVFEGWSIYVAILAALVIAGIKGFKKIKTYVKTDSFFIIHSEIHELLTELRLLTDSARTQLLQLHNGEYFMDGVSMRKFSLTHESLEKTISSDGSRIRGLLCSMFIPLLTCVMENNPKMNYARDMKDSFFKQYLESRNVEAFSVLPIEIKNQITGFIMVQWCSILKAEAIEDNKTESIPFYKEMIKIRNSVEVQLTQQNKQ